MQKTFSMIVDLPPRVPKVELSTDSIRTYELPFSTVRSGSCASGAGAEVVYNQQVRVLRGYNVVVSYRHPINEEFESLVRQWKRDTLFESSPYRMAMHPAYRRIIGMGEKAIPLILAKLLEKPDFWFEALNSITGVQAVPRVHAGNINEMAKDWIAWGRRHNYVA